MKNKHAFWSLLNHARFILLQNHFFLKVTNITNSFDQYCSGYWLFQRMRFKSF